MPGETRGGRTFFDTNVLVYLFDDEAPRKREIARALVLAKGTAGDAVISTQVLEEFYVVLTKKWARSVPPEAVEKAVRDFARWPLVQIGAPSILAAIERSRSRKIAFWDALIVQAALEGDCDTLATEDLQSGRVIDGLKIENPFAVESPRQTGPT